ncbi:MAG: ABC transporter substrate-binding protein [Actinomycetota bacterium]
MPRALPVGAALAVAAAPLALAAGAAAVPARHEAAACTAARLPVIHSGVLTLATENPAFPPWFGGGVRSGSPWKVSDPASGKGYESAVARAVALRLGFAPSAVRWVAVPFSAALRPGRKSFDIFVNQVSITSRRARDVDFSSSYYNVSQSIVAVDGRRIAAVRSVAGLKRFRLGAQAGSTSLDVITATIRPTRRPRAYGTNTQAVSALKEGRIDGLVVDLPTGYYVSAVQVPNGKIIGQFRPAGTPERFGMVLAKGSGLTSCVNRAIAELRADGTIARLEERWLAGAAAPVLR